MTRETVSYVLNENTTSTAITFEQLQVRAFCLQLTDTFPLPGPQLVTTTGTARTQLSPDFHGGVDDKEYLWKRCDARRLVAVESMNS